MSGLTLYIEHIIKKLQSAATIKEELRKKTSVTLSDITFKAMKSRSLEDIIPMIVNTPRFEKDNGVKDPDPILTTIINIKEREDGSSGNL